MNDKVPREDPCRLKNGNMNVGLPLEDHCHLKTCNMNVNIVVSILACHTGDPGSIPNNSAKNLEHLKYMEISK